MSQDNTAPNSGQQIDHADRDLVRRNQRRTCHKEMARNTWMSMRNNRDREMRKDPHPRNGEVH